MYQLIVNNFYLNWVYNLILLLFIFFIGAIFGSFASVLLTRLDNIKSWSDLLFKIKLIILSRSKCPNCWHKLWIFNLIPIFSYIFQNWKCSFCKNKIPKFYLFIEILSGLYFVLFYIFFKDFLFLFSKSLFLIFFIINWLLLLLLIWDIKTKFLHDVVYFITLFLSIFVYLKNFSFVEVLSILSIFVWFFVLLYIFSKKFVKYKYWLNQEWLGFGDVLLSILIWLNFNILFLKLDFNLFNVFYFFSLWLVISSLLSLFFYILYKIYIYLVWNNKKHLLSNLEEIPFFPWLIVWYWFLVIYVFYIFN